MKGYSLVVSKAGDWTTQRIEDPPKEMWVRGIPTFGVLRIVPLFRRVVFVATGSGIGPCAPCILEQRIPIRLLWTSPNVRKTFGDKLVDSIIAASPDAVIYGKPFPTWSGRSIDTQCYVQIHVHTESPTWSSWRTALCVSSKQKPSALFPIRSWHARLSMVWWAGVSLLLARSGTLKQRFTW